jgi:hypothetical protein
MEICFAAIVAFDLDSPAYARQAPSLKDAAWLYRDSSARPEPLAPGIMMFVFFGLAAGGIAYNAE